MTATGDAPLVSAAQANAAAAAARSRVSALLQTEAKGSAQPGKCVWHLVTLQELSAGQRAAVAWMVADAIMRTRCGNAPAYDQWRQAALAGRRLDGRDREKLEPFVSSVFGTPNKPGSVDHVEGHVAEWLWYLLMSERAATDRQTVLLEPPKLYVTEPGPDGFVVYALDGQPMIFRLWELKKHVGKGEVSATVRDAYSQLRTEGRRYLAQLTGMHADKTGDLGELCGQLVDFWVDADDRAGAGVGVTSGKLPAPKRCFTTMGQQLKQFQQPGQLEGMLCAVQDYRALAIDVRRFVWSAL